MGETETNKLGRYVVSRLLGKGAMGVVYEGTDPEIGRRVAIKTIHEHLLDGDNGQELRLRFKREAQAAGRLIHPNVVTIYEYGEIKNVPYIVMEFIRGRELKSCLSDRVHFGLSRATKIMNQVLSAMAYVHDSGVVHRDMKPANIFLLAGDLVKLTDFGIARMADSSLTQVGALMGTPSYMSPEQVMGRTVDHRADLFSVGVILYELLTGRKPFAGGSPASTMQKILYEPVAQPTSCDADLPAAFNAVIDKALAKQPEDRFQNAESFLEAIQLAARGEYSLLLQPTDHTLNTGATVVFTKIAEVSGQSSRAGKPSPGGAAPSADLDLKRQIFQAMLETAYEFTLDGILTAEARSRLVRKAESMGLDGAEITSIEQEVASRLAVQKTAVFPQPPPTPQTGSLKVESVGFSDEYPVEFLLDGRSVGVAPVTVSDLSPGDYRYRLQAADHREVSGKVTIIAGREVLLRKRLSPFPGRIVVVSEPDGAQIWLNGEFTKSKSNSEVIASPGVHVLKIALYGYVTIEKEIHVKPNGSGLEKFVLVNNKGRLSLTSTPSKATIWVDGRDTTFQTDITLGLEVGNRLIVLKKEGYQESSRTVAVALDSYQEENFILKELPVRSDSPSPETETCSRPKSAFLPSTPSGAKSEGTAKSGPEQWLKDNGDGTITDTRHGLIMPKDLTWFDDQTWDDALLELARLASGTCGLSDNSVAGDWRLPGRYELPFLLDWKKSGLFVGVQSGFDGTQTVAKPVAKGFSFFQTTQPPAKPVFREPVYWSGDAIGSSVYTINLYNCKENLYGKKNLYNVWPVRSKGSG